MRRRLVTVAKLVLLVLPAALLAVIPAASSAAVVHRQSLPGVVHLSTGWTLGDSLSTTPATTTFTYGTRPLVPIMGDWDGNGSKTAGTFEAGTFKLRNTNAGGAPDGPVFTFGDPRGFPVAGDFDGNGIDDVAVFRAGIWQIHYLGAGAPADPVAFTFGPVLSWPTVVPVAGDWNGDGIDGIGTYNLAGGAPIGQWNLRNTASTGGPDAGTFIYNPGTSPYPVVGDWNADGTDTVGVKAGTTWNLRNSNSVGAPDVTPFDFGLANDLPVVWTQAGTPASVTVVKSEPTPGAGTTVTAGQATPLTYQLAVNNSGSNASGAVTVNDAVPAGTTYVAGSASCGATPNCSPSFTGSTVTWALTSVAAGFTGNVTFQVTVNAGTGGSTISNSATFTNVATPGCAPATCPTNAVTNPVVSPASITVTKSETAPGAGTSVTAGQARPVSYKLAVTNAGGTASAAVTVTDGIPSGTTYVAGSASCGTTPNCSVSFASGTVTWNLTSVAAGATGNLTFQVTVNLSTADGATVSNAATFTNVNTPGCGTPTCTSNSVTNPVVIPPPVVVAQSYSGAVGNTTFGVGTNPPEPKVAISGNLLTGDSDPTGHTLTASGPGTTTQGGTVTVNGDGTFTYNPPAGFTGNDTFTYTVSNGFHTASNTVTLTVASRVWYVNRSLGRNGTGTSVSPFNTLASVTGPAGPTATGDFIFLFASASNYTGGIVLKANQTLVGQSVGLVIGGKTVVTASGSNPTITNTAANPVVTLAENDTIRGVSISAAAGPAVSATGINATTIESTASITSGAGNGLSVSGGNGALNVAARITTTGGRSVSVANRTGGTVTLSGLLTDTGTGVLLTTNTGATINFTGGLVASTGSNPAFTATGGGTVTVTGAANTLTTTTGTALNVANTNIGASGLTFKSISSNGAVNGILLNTTGATGGLTVTGTPGTAASGGTIQSSTGSGISASNTTNLHLSWMSILNNGDALNEDGLRLVNVFGTGELTSSTVSGSFEDNVYLSNSSGTLTSFNIQGPSCTIANNNTSSGNTGISVLATLTSAMTVTINNCAFHGNRSDAIHTDTADSSNLHATVTNNVITAGTGGANQGNIGVDVSSALTSTLTYDVESNKIGTDGTTNAPLLNTGINVFAGNNSTATGKVIGNTVVNAGAGVSGSGIRIFQSGSSTLNAKVSGNTVSNVGFDFGIDATDNGSGTGPSTGKLNIAVTNNNASVFSTAINAIRVRGRRDTTTCASITGNTATTNGGGNALSLSEANTAVYRLEIVPPPPLGPLTDAQATAEAASLNPAAVGVEAFSTSSSGITGVAVGTCSGIPT